MTFEAYAQAGFATELLPILPHNAEIHPDSPAFDSLTSNRGKVPGRKRRGGWMGFPDWTDAKVDPADFPIWGGWGAGIGMQGRRFPALDIDVDDLELADAIHETATSTLGDAPARFGRGSRRILVYAGAGFAKRRVAFRRRDGHRPPDGGQSARAGGARAGRGDDLLDKAADAAGADKPQAVEFLASGQQYVVEGIHPKTGSPYFWRDGRSPVQVGASGLTPITPAQLDLFYERLEGLLELFGYEVVSKSALNGGEGGVWQQGLLAPSVDAVRRAIAALPNEVDYDTWLKIGAAIKSSCGPDHGDDAFDIWSEWSLQWPENTPEVVEAKWLSLEPPFKVGWDFLASFATDEGDGTFHAVHEDFDAVAPTPLPGEESKGPLVSPKVQALFDRYVWVERLERACDLRTGELLNRNQFNVRNSHIGPPTSNTECAWAVLISNPRRLQAVKAVTYRPGGELFVTENLPGLVGPCVNRWRDPCVDLPASATDADVQTWLDHVAFVIPDERERSITLDWLAWVAQNPGEKPNWSLVIGSTAEGMGKDLMLDPVRVALGPVNVREVGPEDLASANSDYLENTRLLIVEEMEMAERKAMMNRLKPLVAAPPYTLRVNIKFQPQFEIPNLLAVIFFTNMDNALALSRQGRRYFVTWNDGDPKPDTYYTGLAAWFAAGGAAKAARWLLQRDVSGFNAKGRAPDTAAKEAMQRASRSVLEEWLETSVEDETGAFATDIVALEDVWCRLPDYAVGRARPTMQRLASAMKRAGCKNLGRVRLGKPLTTTENDRATLWAVRRADMVVGLEPKKLVELYWQQRARAEAA